MRSEENKFLCVLLDAVTIASWFSLPCSVYRLDLFALIFWAPLRFLGDWPRCFRWVVFMKFAGCVLVARSPILTLIGEGCLGGVTGAGSTLLPRSRAPSSDHWCDGCCSKSSLSLSNGNGLHHLASVASSSLLALSLIELPVTFLVRCIGEMCAQ